MNTSHTATYAATEPRTNVVGRGLTLLTRTMNLLQAPFALATRLYVSWVFLNSGWLKATAWSQTVSLFESEYKVPLLSPVAAAFVGTFGELFFPVLLILGLGGRVGALGLSAVNAMAVISYAHVLYSEGFEAAIGQHYLWGFMLAALTVYGPGAFSLDRMITRRNDSQAW